MPYNPYRLNRIFGGDLEPPTMPPDLDIIGLMNTINPMVDKDNLQRRKDFTEDRQWDRNAKLADIAAQMERENQPTPPIRQPLPGSSGRPMPNPVIPNKVNQQPQPQPTRVNPAIATAQNEANKKPNYVTNIMSPYEQATIDFKNRELEQKRSMGSDRLDVTREGQEGRLDLGQERNKIAEFKAKNPGMKIQVSKGGNFVAFDPVSGKVIDTGISSGTMSERDKLDVTNAGDMAEIGARGDIQKDIQGMRGEQGLAQVAARVAGQKDIQATRGEQSLANIAASGGVQQGLQNTRGEQSLAQIAARGGEQRATNAAKPGTSMQPSQTKVQESNAARQLINTNPELAPFIKQNQDGTYSVTPPGEASLLGGAKPTQDQFNKINSILYPKSGSAAPAAGTKTPPKAPAGWKYVPKAGGGWTAVEDK